MQTIHPTAVVDSKAELDSTVSVGPYSVIGPDVKVDAGDGLTITVQDNGKGLPADQDGREERFGLMGMRERAEGLGGTFQLESEDGVRVSVKLPLHAAEVL